MATPSFFRSPSAGWFALGRSSWMGIPRSPIHSIPQSTPSPSRQANINPVSRGLSSSVSVVPSAPVRSIPLQTQVVKNPPPTTPAQVPAPENVLLQKQAFISSETIEARISEAQKNNKDPKKLASEVAQVFFNVVDENKWEKWFSRIAKALPKDTPWEDLRFHITKWNPKSAWVIVRIYIKDGYFDTITYSDIHIRNKNGKTPNTWIILCLLGLDQKLSWLSDTAPASIRQAKKRLSDSLKKFMDMDSEPFYTAKNKKEYHLRMNITAELDVRQKFESYSWFSTWEAINHLLEKHVDNSI